MADRPAATVPDLEAARKKRKEAWDRRRVDPSPEADAAYWKATEEWAKERDKCTDSTLSQD